MTPNHTADHENGPAPVEYVVAAVSGLSGPEHVVFVIHDDTPHWWRKIASFTGEDSFARAQAYAEIENLPPQVERPREVPAPGELVQRTTATKVTVEHFTGAQSRTWIEAPVRRADTTVAMIAATPVADLSLPPGRSRRSFSTLAHPAIEAEVLKAIVGLIETGEAPTHRAIARVTTLGNRSMQRALWALRNDGRVTCDNDGRITGAGDQRVNLPPLLRETRDPNTPLNHERVWVAMHDLVEEGARDITLELLARRAGIPAGSIGNALGRLQARQAVVRNAAAELMLLERPHGELRLKVLRAKTRRVPEVVNPSGDFTVPALAARFLMLRGRTVTQSDAGYVVDGDLWDSAAVLSTANRLRHLPREDDTAEARRA